MNIEDLGFVKASTYREKVILTLNENKVLIPKKIAQLSDIRINHISKTLKELTDKGLVVCLNNEARKGRLYQLTKKGKEIAKYLQEELK